jgi:hypothetical protein
VHIKHIVTLFLSKPKELEIAAKRLTGNYARGDDGMTNI